MGKQVERQNMDLTNRENVDRHLTCIRNVNYSEFKIDTNKVKNYGVQVCEDVNWLKSFIGRMPEKYKSKAFTITEQYRDKYLYLVNYMFINQKETDLYYMTLSDMIRVSSMNFIVSISKLTEEIKEPIDGNKINIGRKALHLCNTLMTKLNKMTLSFAPKNTDGEISESANTVKNGILKSLEPTLDDLKTVAEAKDINICKDIKLNCCRTLTTLIEESKVNFNLKYMYNKQAFAQVVVSTMERYLSSKTDFESSLYGFEVKKTLCKYLLLLKFSNKDEKEKTILTDRYCRLCRKIVIVINQAVDQLNNQYTTDKLQHVNGITSAKELKEETVIKELAVTEKTETTKTETVNSEAPKKTAKEDLKALTRALQHLSEYSDYESIKDVMKSLTKLQCELIESL